MSTASRGRLWQPTGEEAEHPCAATEMHHFRGNDRREREALGPLHVRCLGGGDGAAGIEHKDGRADDEQQAVGAATHAAQQRIEASAPDDPDETEDQHLYERDGHVADHGAKQIDEAVG